jgi:Uma2 family endonuclease
MRSCFAPTNIFAKVRCTPPTKIVTLEEFLKLPETEPASEYINGRIIQKPMPQGEHSAIQTELPPTINSVVRSQKIARAFSELRCTFGGRSIVPQYGSFNTFYAPEIPLNPPHRCGDFKSFLVPPFLRGVPGRSVLSKPYWIIPDVSIFLWNRIPRQENGAVANVFSITPDWTIEILSPDQSQTKVIKNILHCLKHGTLMGWLIDPSEQCVFVYLRDRPTAFYDELDILLPVPEFAREFNLTVKSLFNWLLE